MLLLPACNSPTLESPPATAAGPAEERIPTDTATEDPGPEKDERGCSDLYDRDTVEDFEVEIEPIDLAALEADYRTGDKQYHPIAFRRGDERVDDAMIRLKGNPGFSWFTEKMQFVIAFNEVDEAGRFHGLRKLSLDASWYEPTLLRDRISWSVMERAGGLPTACANTARLTVNGDYYGLYTSIEYFDHEWLERNFGAESTGTLWKYGYDAVSNAEAADGDAIAALWSTTDVATLETLGDVEEWTLEWAAEAVLGDDDGYWCCNHNYYLYEHPSRGILFVPWDFDDNFDVQGYDVDPVEGYYEGLFQQAQFHAIVSDPAWRTVYVDQLEKLNEAMEPELVLAEIDTIDLQITDLFEADPKRSIGWEERAGALERMRAWVPARHAFLDSWIACERGLATDADADGHTVCDDPDDADATVHPGATETCNGIDDDADGWIDDRSDCDDCARHDLEDHHFLFCRWPRTYSEAEQNCASRGGQLTTTQSEGDIYMFFFYTWPVREVWWTSGGESAGRCPGWDEANFSVTTASCAEPHPSVCAVP